MKAHLDVVENGDVRLPSRRWRITRSGWNRQYKMGEAIPVGPVALGFSTTTTTTTTNRPAMEFVWKGSMGILDRLDDTAPRCMGI